MTHPTIRLAAILALANAAISDVQAQQQAGPTADPVGQCLRFGEALSLGARLGPEVDTANARLAESEAELQQARSLFRPQISSFVRSGIGDSGLAESQIQNQVGLRASQRVFDFGDAKLAREAAGASVAARRLDIAATQATAAEAVGRSYLGWLETRDRLAATREREEYFGRQLAATRQLLTRGGSTVADRADIEAEYLDAQSARVDLDFSLERFATLLTINTKRASAPCDVEDASNTLSRSTPSDASAATVQALLVDSPSIESLRRSADSLSYTADREARARYPVISVSGIGSYAVQDFDTRGALRNRVGIDISLPLYSGNAQTGRIEAARARARQAFGRLGEARRKLEEDLSIGLRKIAALQILTVRRSDAAKNRNEQLLAAEAQFARGLRTLPELIETRLQFEAAQLANITAQYDLMREQLRILQLTNQFETP